MGLDPRRASASAQGRSAQTISELETRISRLENSTKGAILSSGTVSQTAGSFTVTTSFQDVPGLTVTLTSQVATTGVFIITQSVQSAGGEVYISNLYLNSVSVAGQAINAYSPTGYYATPTGTYKINLPAGSNTIKLMALRAGGTSSLVSSGRITYFQTRA